MGAPDTIGEHDNDGLVVSNIDVRGWSFTKYLSWCSYTRPASFIRLAEAISRGNISLENQILRCWGIRRGDVEATLSRNRVRLPDMHERTDEEGCSDW